MSTPTRRFDVQGLGRPKNCRLRGLREIPLHPLPHACNCATPSHAVGHSRRLAVADPQTFRFRFVLAARRGVARLQVFSGGYIPPPFLLPSRDRILLSRGAEAPADGMIGKGRRDGWVTGVVACLYPGVVRVRHSVAVVTVESRTWLSVAHIPHTRCATEGWALYSAAAVARGHGAPKSAQPSATY